MSGNPGARRRVKYLAVLAIALFVSAGIAGYYSFGMDAPGTGAASSTISSTTSSSSSTCATAPLAKNQQLSPTTFNAITG